MPRTTRIEGVVGSITWSYYEAARIEGYRVSIVQGHWGLRARLLHHDAFKLAQRPLIFCASLKGGRVWRWPIETHRMESRDIFVARLGAPMKG